MPIHFAASRRLSDSPLARHLAAPRMSAAANDNYGEGAGALIDNPLLRATLEHFAVHGLAAAAQARDMAEGALSTENGDDYRHWTAVCRMLDRRMAGQLTRRARGRRER